MRQLRTSQILKFAYVSSQHKSLNKFTQFSVERCQSVIISIHNNTRLVNQHTRELTGARNTSHKYNKKDLSRLRSLWRGMRVNTSYISSIIRNISSTKGTSSYRAQKLCGSRGGHPGLPSQQHPHTSGRVDVPCIYTHARWHLCYAFRALINSPVCWFSTSALGLVLFQICDN